MVKLPDNLKDFGYETEQVPEEVDRSAANNLNILIEQAEKLQACYLEFAKSSDSRMRDYLLEAMGSYLNHFSQAFRDIMTYILINNSQDGKKVYDESLGYCVRQYFTLEIERTLESEKAAEYLKMRNDLIHDYFNINKRNYDLSVAMESYGNGFSQMATDLRDYCYMNYPNVSLAQDIKSSIKAAKKQDK